MNRPLVCTAFCLSGLEVSSSALWGSLRGMLMRRPQLRVEFQQAFQRLQGEGRLAKQLPAQWPIGLTGALGLTA